MENLTTIILAGGLGTRMKSPLPKVLHPVAGVPMIARIIAEVKKAGSKNVRVVLGHGLPLVQKVIEPLGGVQIYKQEKQLGTADAVKSADLATLTGTVLIVNGDHPLITAEELKSCLVKYQEQKLDVAVVSAELKDPGQFGRIIRKDGKLHSIKEAKDASITEIALNEVNTGIYVARAEVLQKLIPRIENKNAKNEFYLTDLISLALAEKLQVDAIRFNSENLSQGVNSQIELAQATALIYKRNAERAMNEGVILISPQTTYIEDLVKIGPGTVIYPGAFLRGKTAVGPYCVIEPNSFISDCVIEDGVQIKMGSHLEQVIIKSQAQVGPYARLRPDTVIGEHCKVGNFVEMKKVQFGNRSKASHLTYLGDAEIGQDVNIGCGTITCNFAPDEKKYKTIIKDRVFVGSDSQLVAPITVHEDAIIASGSTVTAEVPAGALAIARGRQENKLGLAAKFKKKKES